MKEFKQEDYIIPDNDINSSEKKINQQENPESKNYSEQIETKIKQARVFFESVDNISHKNDFKGETAYVDKVKELEQEKNNLNTNKILENKIYYQNILNLFESHKKALEVVALKEEQHKPGELPSSEELYNKLDEISERKAILERHLYDLRNYIE